MSRWISCLVAIGLAACSSPPTPKDTFYRLEIAQPAERFARPPLPGVLEVNRFDTDGVLAERALAYQEGTALQRYRYEFWSEAPGLMLQDRVAAWAAAANAAERVVTPDLRVPPDYVLRGKLRRFEQVGATVAVEMQLAIIGARDGAVILIDTYSAQPASAGPSPDAAAAAMGVAVGDILTRFRADLAQAARK